MSDKLELGGMEIPGPGSTARLVELKAKLKAREGKKAYKENCDMLRAEIARIEK